MPACVASFLTCLRSDRRGVTALEYGVIAAATILAITAVLPNISTALSGVFTSIQSAL